MLVRRRDLVAGLAALPIAAALPARVGVAAEPGGPPCPADGPVRPAFGTAVRPDQLMRKGSVRDAIRRDCTLLVPEFHGQWSAVEWRRGNPWFGNYDAIVAYGAAHSMAVRGHSLIWEQMTPDWARASMRHDRDWSVVERHFANLLPRYAGRIGEWIVVNEMIDTVDGQHDMRRTGFQRAFGNGYVQRALETAHALDPTARLAINDYSLEHDNPVDEARRVAMLKLVERLKARGVPLHIVGIQAHLELGKGAIPEARFARFLQDLADMGVEIALTELDVLEDDRSGTAAVRDRRVADMTRALVGVAADQPKVTSLVTWGMSDRDSWLQERAAATLG